MVTQVVRLFPVAPQAVDPGDAFTASALHFQHMGHAVCRPKIAGIAVDRCAPRGFGFGVIAAFLMREAAAAEYGAVAWEFVAPIPFNAQHGRKHGIRAAEPEIDEVRQAKCQHVAWMFAKDLFPDGGGTIRLAIDPALQGSDMRAFPRRCALSVRFASATAASAMDTADCL